MSMKIIHSDSKLLVQTLRRHRTHVDKNKSPYISLRNAICEALKDTFCLWIEVYYYILSSKI